MSAATESPRRRRRRILRERRKRGTQPTRRGVEGGLAGRLLEKCLQGSANPSSGRVRGGGGGGGGGGAFVSRVASASEQLREERGEERVHLFELPHARTHMPGGAARETLMHSSTRAAGVTFRRGREPEAGGVAIAATPFRVERELLRGEEIREERVERGRRGRGGGGGGVGVGARGRPGAVDRAREEHDVAGGRLAGASPKDGNPSPADRAAPRGSERWRRRARGILARAPFAAASFTGRIRSRHDPAGADDPGGRGACVRRAWRAPGDGAGEGSSLQPPMTAQLGSKRCRSPPGVEIREARDRAPRGTRASASGAGARRARDRGRTSATAAFDARVSTPGARSPVRWSQRRRTADDNENARRGAASGRRGGGRYERRLW